MKYIAVGLLAIALSACSTDQAQDEEQAQIDPAPAKEAEVEVKEEFNPIPFDPEAGVAHLTRLSDVIHHVHEKLGSQHKGQFETTEAFEARIAKAQEDLAPLDFGQIYVVADPNVDLKYDADTEIYSLWSPPVCFNVPMQFPDWHACELDDLTVQTKVDGQDILGRNIQVVKSRGVTYYALLTPQLARKFARPRLDAAIPIECPVPLDRAEELYDTFRIGFGVRFTKAQIIDGFDYVSSATIDIPVDVHHQRIGIPADITHLVCFDEATGEVLHQTEF